MPEIKLAMSGEGDAATVDVENGMPVIINAEGARERFDIPKAMEAIGRLSGERNESRTQFEGAERNRVAVQKVLDDLGDLEKVRHAVQVAGQIDDGQLIDAEKMAERLTQVRDDTAEKFTEQVTGLQSQNSVLRDVVIKAKRRGIFTDHPFLDSLQPAIRPVAVLMAQFGAQWQPAENDNGNGVEPVLIPHGWDGKPLQSKKVEKVGQIASDEEALELLIRSHPNASTFLVNDKGGGAGSQGGEGGGDGDEFTVTNKWVRANFRASQALKEKARKAGRRYIVKRVTDD